jgi:hypothetical protein
VNTALPALYTPTTDVDFLRVFNRLCVALREPPDDSGVTQSTYFELLHDLPITAIEAGAEALMRGRDEDGRPRRFFPTSAEWRTAAEHAQTEQLRQALPAGRDKPWEHECGACEDTGWRYQDCDGSNACGRETTHTAHPYVTVCPCRSSNRTFARHQKFGVGA